MAKAKPRKRNNSGITEFPAPPGDSEPSDVAVPLGEPPETPPQPAKASEPPPRKPHSPLAVPKMLTFFQQLEKIPLADWGTRAKIRVYRLEPIIDMRRGSQTKYICIYTEAVDEERIKRDLGSGRYRLFLNIKVPGGQEERETDSVEFDILDRNFPPVIPEGTWVDDPINKKWAWAKPQMPGNQNQSGATASGAMLEAVQVLGELQDRAEERAKERIDSGRPQSNWDPAQQLQTVANVAKEMATALKATPENPIPQFISDQMAAMRTELADARKRSDTLMDKLLDMAKAPQPQQQNGLSAVKEIMQGIKDFLPTVRDLWPNAPEDIAERVVKSKMGPWQEFFAPVLPKLVDALAPIMPGIAAGLMGNAAQSRPSMMPVPARLPNPAMPQPGPQAQPQGQHAPNLDEMLLNALTNDRDGGEFADSLVMLFGQQGQLMYRQAASLGEQGLLTLIQQRPIWQQLGPLQSKVAQFVHEFIEYGQEEPAEQPVEGTEPTATDDKVVDLTGEASQ